MKSIVVYSIVITLLLSLAQFNLPSAFGGKIDDAAVGHGPVRDDHPLVVRRQHNGIEYLHLLDNAEMTLGFNQVADAVGLENQDKDAAGKVSQAALQRQADGQAGRTEDGNKRGGRYTDHRGDTDKQQDLQDPGYQIGNEWYQCLVGFRPFQGAPDKIDDGPDDPESDDQGNDCQHHPGRIAHEQLNRLVGVCS